MVNPGTVIRNRTAAEKAADYLREIANLLLVKAASYGNSLEHPVHVFSQLSPRDAVRVRIDDKLSRIAAGGLYPGDDNRTDLIGYLALDKALED